MSMYQDDGESWSPDDGAMGVGMNGSVGESPPPPEPDPGMRGGQLEQYGGVGGAASQLGGAIADAGNMTIQQSGQAFRGNAQRVMGAAVGDEKAQKLMAYLMGHDAADQEAAKKFEQGVKHENPGISDDDANLLAVEQAGKMGGPAAAWAMVQYNRAAYNAKASFAKTALNGIDGKAGDLQAAADAATQAGAHILDGTSAVFTAMPGGQGFTVAVKMPGTDKTVTAHLTPQQFAELTDIGKAGQYDRLMETGGYMMAIRKLAKGTGADGLDDDHGVYSPPGAPKTQEEADQVKIPATDTMNPSSTPTPGAPLPAQGAQTPPEGQSLTDVQKADAAQDEEQDDPDNNPYPGTEAQPGYHPGEANPWDAENAAKPRQPGDEGAIPGTHDKDGHFLGPTAPSVFNKKYEDRADEVFGKGNIGATRRRAKWMADYEERDQREQDKLDQANAGNTSKERIAKMNNEGKQGVAETNADAGIDKENIRAQARIAAAKERANVMLKQLEANTNDRNTKNAIAKSRLEVNDPSFLFRKPGDFANILKRNGVPVPAGTLMPEVEPPDGKSADAGLPQSGGGGRGVDTVPPIKERVMGKVYNTPKGSFKWMGTGWQPQ